jgi:hypothetical protein
MFQQIGKSFAKASGPHKQKHWLSAGMGFAGFRWKGVWIPPEGAAAQALWTNSYPQEGVLDEGTANEHIVGKLELKLLLLNALRSNAVVWRETQLSGFGVK